MLHVSLLHHRRNKLISIYYPSGRKSRFITDEKEKKVCKIVFRGKDIGSGLRDFLKTSHPEELIEGSVAILGDECKTLCKRNSGSVLQDKSIQNVMEFTWDKLYTELQIRAPNILKIVSAMVNDIPIQDIERIAKFGASVHPETLRRKLNSWDEYLDEELLKYKTEWSRGGNKKYQLIGDNWDRNIIPSYRTSQDKTLSLHLFQVIGVVDRVDSFNCAFDPQLLDILELTPVDFIPSVADQDILLHELTFLVANAVIANIEQLNGAFGYIYPKHLKHKYSEFSGMKTEQYSLGLFDCNEMVTQDVIRLLKDLSKKYVPIDDAGEIVEEVFFGGDRLTDERIQSAQEAMTNNENPLDKFEGFISKIEDFHRLMNFLEAIVLQTYSTQSANDRGTVYYYKNILNARNVKGKVKNSYRGYKMLYRTIFDAMCCAFFLKEFGLLNLTESIPLPDEFSKWTGEEKIQWMNNICERIVNKWFFGDSDLFEELRQVLSDPDHEENYWFGNFKDGRFSCHYCEKTYCHIKSAEFHEKEVHGHSKPALRKSKQANLLQDELFDYLIALFRLSALHRNLDTAVDMADGYRSIRSAKYETPLYNKTHKTKYLIGSIHLTGLVSGTLPPPQTERLIANRCINLSGGKNSNMALDEYVELVNRDTKNTCSGFQTKESIIAHSKQFPLLIKAVKNLDMINDVHRRKGFHNIPSYKSDVRKIVQDLFDIDGFSQHKGRKLKCRELVQKSNPFADSYKQLVNMIYRHKPLLPFRRLRNKQL
ncbi:uncharacterized protein LOC125657360 isoform X2 [Ostrea edulis]|uniref:uncharacterized protein LOC125657360 isoform X2 n=1 Tax=Ostrea edulis TaxID=37623 RepID=UPI0024AF369F|nr:uncharacterized protein LOC125657360 isoform X2 [Ostrea edulis]